LRVDRTNPFVGPRPFEQGERLFGRDREISELQLRLSAERIVLLHSPSGAGKSSLLQAGLLPLVARSFDVWGPTRVNAEPAAAEANRYLLSAMQGFEEGVPAALRRPVGDLAGQSLAGYFEKRPRRRSAPPNVLLVIDQFEEILTVDPLGVDAKRAFFEQLGELLRNPRVWALFALREDYLAPLDPYARQVPTQLKSRFRIDLLGLAAAREAIVEPARAGGREFPAVDELVTDLATMKVQQVDGAFVDETGQHVEPVQLQVVCRRLWDALPEDDLVIGAESLERFGDVSQALAAYYADSVARIAAEDPGRERAIREWFGEKLITPGGLRGQVLREAGASGGLANGLIEQLLATHLVRAEQRAGATWYELAHDRLIEPLTSDNAAWREAHLAGVQRRAALWERQGRPAGLLLAGEELADLELWAAENAGWLTETERKFLAESRQAREVAEREQRQQRRIRWLALGATVIGVLALCALFVARSQWRQTQEALARVYLNEARRLTEGGEGRKALAYHALFLRRNPDNPAARGWTCALLFHTGAVTPSSPLRHEERINSGSFSPDGRLLVTASEDATARVWDTATGGLVIQLSHDFAVKSASFSPDGRRLVTASADGTARVWDARPEAMGRPIGAPLRHAGGVWSAAFSPDSRRLVTASEDGTARVWDAATGQPLGPPMRHSGEVLSASFSPDGLRILTLSKEGAVQVWNAVTGEPAGAPLSDAGNVLSASFSPEGRTLVTASAEGMAQLWDAANGRPVGAPMQPRSPGFLAASFSPDGRLLVTASSDGTAQVWDAANGQPVGEPMMHHGRVLAAAFRRGSGRVVTGSEDGVAQEWDVITRKPVREPIHLEGLASSVSYSPDGLRLVAITSDGKAARVWSAASSQLGAPLRHDGVVRSASFSPDGRRAVTASEDDTAQVWDAVSGLPIGAPLRHGATVVSASFSPDGSRVVTASFDGTAQVWDAATGKPMSSPIHLEGPVHAASFSPEGRRLLTAASAARIWDAATGQAAGQPMHASHGSVGFASFSPDGRWVVTAADDNTARVWDAATGQPRGQPMGHRAPVLFAKFSPDGERVVTGSADTMARVWVAATGRPMGQPLRHDGPVLTAAFSPDGKWVVTGSADKTARLWDAVTGRPVGETMLHESGVRSVAFTPQGQRIVTASYDGTARLWEATTGLAMGEPLRHGKAVNTAVFSPDGLRVLTASDDKTARIWDVLFGSVGDAEDLAEVAEAIGGYRVTELGELEAMPAKERAERLARLRQLGEQAPANQPTVASFARWYFTPRLARSVSLLSTMPVEEYIRRLLAVGTEDARREAEAAFPGHPLLAAGK